MMQWRECKAEAGDALLLFRLGDFYEAFYEDATTLSEALDVTLTKRIDVPMAGIPVQTLEQYLEKLIAKNMCVAIAEQVEDPKATKGIVKRKVTQILSPATFIPSLTPDKSGNHFFASIVQINATLGIAFIDISTSDAIVLEVESPQELFDEMIKKSPVEILISSKFAKDHPQFLNQLNRELKARINVENPRVFDFSNAIAFLQNHFKTAHLDGLGLKGYSAATSALGGLFCYLTDDRHLDLSTIHTIQVEHLGEFLKLDHTTLQHLEIYKSSHEDTSLLKTIDRTETAMGARLIKSWILHPLTNTESIQKRQDAIEELLCQKTLSLKLHHTLSQIKDLRRLCMKIDAKSINPKELTAYLHSLSMIPKLKHCMQDLKSPLMQSIAKRLIDTAPLVDLIGSALSDHPPVKLGRGETIREGYHQELDELRFLKQGSEDYLLNYQNALRQKLDIKTLKVSFNRAFGYYIEVSKLQAKRMPEGFERRQTLVNNERFISQELKEFEHKILNAEARIECLEEQLYDALLEKLRPMTQSIADVASAIGEIDVLYSLARIAFEYGYARPLVDDSSLLHIKEGRHPIIEKALLQGSFIANDTQLSEKEKMMIITGPNMAGKSTYIRQVALIVILAQMGSFVPAKQAHIGLLHRIFTRIGASDDLSRGLSTFMVEMNETASILNQYDAKSLIILDEIGRGTSTYDGISIAWAVATTLIHPLEQAPKTLFATHYFELTDMENHYEGVKNYQVAVQESEDNVVFLRKIIEGTADKSYGIHVAKLAGIPHHVIQIAKNMLASFEGQETKKHVSKPKINYHEDNQLFLFSPPQSKEKNYKDVMDTIKTLNIDETSPLQALQLLSNLKHKLL